MADRRATCSASWSLGRSTGTLGRSPRWSSTARDPRAIVRFWDEALGCTLHEVTDDRGLPRPAEDLGRFVEFLRTSHLKDVWHRVHLDLLPCPVDDRAGEVARLEDLGATPADVGQGDVPWKVLTDPEGNEFCVLGRA